MEREFNLLREPWIRVLAGGAVREVSLVEALRDAQGISRIAGELPTQDAAVLRLLLAVLYATYAQTIAGFHGEDDAIEFWRSLWERGSLDIAAIEAYLQRYEDRFWLFDDAAPFYQCAGLDIGTVYGAAKLMGDLSESNNKLRLFAGRSGDGKRRLDYPEAARWLLYLNAFDDTSAKPTRGGDKKPSVGAGYLGKLGLVYADGESLFETLMLNFIPQSTGGNGRPVWETEPCAIERRLLSAPPDTYAQLFTLQSRRLLLKRESNKVVGFILLGGDSFEIENAFIEYMTVWGGKDDIYRPKRHNPSKSFWRDFAALTMNNDGARQPGIVSWIAVLREEKLLPREHIAFRTAGVKYGDKDFFVDDVFSDSVTINAAILSNVGRDWVIRICDVLDKTEQCVSALRRFVRRIEIASGNSDDPKAKDKSSVDAAASQTYFDLDLPFRHWIGGIDPAGDDADDKSEEWYEIVRKRLFAQAEELLENAGTRALTGGKSAIPEYAKFTRAIYKIIRGT
jgi:CRISPR system Cascade subunit CasA